MAAVLPVLTLTALVGCASAVLEGGTQDPTDSATSLSDPSPWTAPGSLPAPASGLTPRETVEVVFLGVGGVSLRWGEDLILTAPMFSNPSLLDVTLGEVISDTALIDAFLPVDDAAGASAILVGHGHYDHLLDVPRVQEIAGPDATIYGNVSVGRLLAGVLGEGGLVAANDPADPRVDRRMCAAPDPCTGAPAGQAGSWIPLPDTQVRVRALCSNHPPQFLDIVRFAEGCVAETWTPPPTHAADWLEGATLAWLVDLLDADGEPVFRVYYQDAPTDSPSGLVHPDLLAGHPVDLAVLNVGSFTAVRDHPAEALANLAPRYALGIHWEDFFLTQEEPVVPIPFHEDPAVFDDAALALLPAGDEAPVLVDGVADDARYWRPLPGARFLLPTGDLTAPADRPADPAVLAVWTETVGDALVLRSELPAWTEDCTLGAQACADADGDGLVDGWEDLVLDRLRPVLRFDEAEPLFWEESVLVDLGRVAPAADGHVRAWIAMAYRDDYGRCGVTAHAGDPERVVLDLAPVDGGGPGDVEVVGLHTAAHEFTETDHSLTLQGTGLAQAELPLDPVTGEPRWRVYPSDGKHASYVTAQLCEDAEWLLCVEEDCGPDGVDDLAAFDRLPPVVNVGEPDAQRLSDLAAVGFPDEDVWVDQDFCGGQDRSSPCGPPLVDKLLDDPFDGG